MRDLVGICGTPGTGKKTTAPIVAKLLGLPEPISVNALAPKGQVYVVPARLRTSLLKMKPARAVVFGHLIPHVLKRSEVAMVAVLRCEPSVLKARLLERGYQPGKATENVEAELIGVVLDECLRAFGSERVREYDTTSTPPKAVAKEIAFDVGRKAKPSPPSWIDWTLDYDSSSKLRSLLAGAEPRGST